MVRLECNLNYVNNFWCFADRAS